MRTVLVVDDNAVQRRAIARLMQWSGAGVIAEAADGQEALTVAEQVHPDLIITDCDMPRMDGMALARRLRERGDRTPLIMVSGQPAEEAAPKAHDAGVNTYLQKPVDFAALLEKVEETVGPLNAAA